MYFLIIAVGDQYVKRNTKMLIVCIIRMNEINRKSTDFKLFFPVTLLRKWM